MSLLRAWKIIAALAGIFGAGAYTGHVVTEKTREAPAARAVSVDEFTHQTLRRLRKELKLKPEEVMRIEGHVEEAGRQLNEEYADTLKRIAAILDEAGAKIRAELDQEQQRRFDELLTETKARIARRSAER